MSISFLPRTQLGKWSLRLMIAFLSLLLIRRAIMVLFQISGGKTFFSNPVLGILMLGSGAAAVIAFLTGAFAVIRNRERSILVFLTTLIGLFILVFIFMEILLPH